MWCLFTLHQVPVSICLNTNRFGLCLTSMSLLIQEGYFCHLYYMPSVFIHTQNVFHVFNSVLAYVKENFVQWLNLLHSLHMLLTCNIILLYDSARLSSCWFLSPRKDILFIDDKFQTIFFEISSFSFLHFFFKIWWKPDI